MDDDFAIFAVRVRPKSSPDASTYELRLQRRCFVLVPEPPQPARTEPAEGDIAAAAAQVACAPAPTLPSRLPFRRLRLSGATHAPTLTIERDKRQTRSKFRRADALMDSWDLDIVSCVPFPGVDTPFCSAGQRSSPPLHHCGCVLAHWLLHRNLFRPYLVPALVPTSGVERREVPVLLENIYDTILRSLRSRPPAPCNDDAGHVALRVVRVALQWAGCSGATRTDAEFALHLLWRALHIPSEAQCLPLRGAACSQLLLHLMGVSVPPDRHDEHHTLVERLLVAGADPVPMLTHPRRVQPQFSHWLRAVVRSLVRLKRDEDVDLLVRQLALNQSLDALREVLHEFPQALIPVLLQYHYTPYALRSLLLAGLPVQPTHVEMVASDDVGGERETAWLLLGDRHALQVDPGLRTPCGVPLAHHLALHGYLSLLQQVNVSLLQPAQPDPAGRTALHALCVALNQRDLNAIEAVRLIHHLVQDCRVPVDARDAAGLTALQVLQRPASGVRRCPPAVVKALLQLGAQPPPAGEPDVPALPLDGRPLLLRLPLADPYADSLLCLGDGTLALWHRPAPGPLAGRGQLVWAVDVPLPWPGAGDAAAAAAAAGSAGDLTPAVELLDFTLACVPVQVQQHIVLIAANTCEPTLAEAAAGAAGLQACAAQIRKHTGWPVQVLMPHQSADGSHAVWTECMRSGVECYQWRAGGLRLDMLHGRWLQPPARLFPVGALLAQYPRAVLLSLVPSLQADERRMQAASVPDRPLPARWQQRHWFQARQSALGPRSPPAIAYLLDAVHTLHGTDVRQALCTASHVLVWLTERDGLLRCRAALDPAAPVHTLPLPTPGRTLHRSSHASVVLVQAPHRLMAVCVLPVPRLLAVYRTAALWTPDATRRHVLQWDGSRLTRHALPEWSPLVGWSRVAHHTYPRSVRVRVRLLLHGLYAPSSVLHVLPVELWEEVVRLAVDRWMLDDPHGLSVGGADA